MNRSFWLLRGLRFALFVALFVAAAVLLTQYLWNWLMPTLFRLPAIGLGQTLGLLVLSRILFGGLRGGQGHGWARRRQQWQQRMASRLDHLGPEEREKFRQQLQHRCSVGWRCRPETATVTTAPPPAQQPA